jgi:transcriptional regulator with XRE-family HTH domain
MQNSYDFALGSVTDNYLIGASMKWNERLKQARDRAGATNTDIAKACKVKPASVTGWMTGETVNIESQNLLSACKLLNVSPFWVMFGEEADESSSLSFLPESSMLPAWDAVKLIALYAQASEDGKHFIMNAAEAAEKSRFAS